MLGEAGIGIMLGLMAEGGIPLAAAVEFVAPGEWELVTEHFPRILVLAGVVEFGQVTRQQHVQTRGHVIYVVELVRPLERGGQVGGRGILGVLHDDGELLHLGVAAELAAYHGPEPGPLAHRTGRGMDAHEPAAGTDIALESGLLFLVVEDFVVGVVEDDGLVTLEILVGKRRRVVGDVHGEIVCGTELLEGGDAGGDVVVDVEPLAHLVLGIDQHPALGSSAEGGHRQASKKDNGKSRGFNAGWSQHEPFQFNRHNDSSESATGAVRGHTMAGAAE